MFALDIQVCIIASWAAQIECLFLTVEEAARREVQEETGLAVGGMRLFGVFSGRDMYYEYPNGDQAAIVSVVYLTNDVTCKLQINDNESLELGYFPTDALSTINLSSPNKPIIKRFLQTHLQTL